MSDEFREEPWKPNPLSTHSLSSDVAGIGRNIRISEEKMGNKNFIEAVIAVTKNDL